MRYIAFSGQRGRTLVKRAAIGLLAAVVAAVSFYFFYISPRRVVPILMYHEISNGKDNSLLVSTVNFEKQMKYIRDRGFNVITLDELVRGVNEGKGFRPRTVVITFDDGSVDNYLNAFPVLVKYKIPATIFLVSGSISKNEEYLTWDQVRVMAANGVEFGGHTRNHVYLPAINDLRVIWDEVAGCREDIKKNAGIDALYFCYPTGGFDARVEDTVKKAGYLGACTTNRGKDKLNRNVYELNRVKITNSDMSKPFHFMAKLSGCYNIFRRVKGNGGDHCGKND